MRDWEINFINQALDIAKKIPVMAGSRHAAILAKRKKIISIGYNHAKTSPFYAKYGYNVGIRSIGDMTPRDPNNNKMIVAHAETHAIYQAIKQGFTDWNKSVLYVVRYGKGHKDGIALSCPCRGCMEAIIDMGISKVIYTNPKNDNKISVIEA